MVTTNLSLRRPHELPFLNRNHFYDPEEFAQFMPAHVMKWMNQTCRKDPHDKRFRYLPTKALMPVILSARMSLSFPILFCAMPIHQRVYRDGGFQRHQKLWLSDGGLSSNLPVHMFDSWLPNRPTFGVSLDPVDPDGPTDRVYLPMSAQAGRNPAYNQIKTAPGFLISILNAAKDWQDQLQMLSTGYKERIVHICLNDKEGGLNLDMDPKIIRRIGGYGAAAGRRFTQSLTPEERGRSVETFDFEDHQWRRFLVLYERLEEDLETLKDQWKLQVVNGKTCREHLRSIAEDPDSYADGPKQSRLDALARVDELTSLVETWNQPIRGKLSTPRPSPVMRIVSSMRQ
jgi:hypothetical protein